MASGLARPAPEIPAARRDFRRRSHERAFGGVWTPPGRRSPRKKPFRARLGIQAPAGSPHRRRAAGAGARQGGARATNVALNGSGHPRPEIATEISVSPAPARRSAPCSGAGPQPACRGHRRAAGAAQFARLGRAAVPGELRPGAGDARGCLGRAFARYVRACWGACGRGCRGAARAGGKGVVIESRERSCVPVARGQSSRARLRVSPPVRLQPSATAEVGCQPSAVSFQLVVVCTRDPRSN